MDLKNVLMCLEKLVGRDGMLGLSMLPMQQEDVSIAVQLMKIMTNVNAMLFKIEHLSRNVSSRMTVQLMSTVQENVIKIGQMITQVMSMMVVTGVTAFSYGMFYVSRQSSIINY